MVASNTSFALQNPCFSPSYCCQDNIVELLQGSQQSVQIAIYAISNKKIAREIINAHRRGVEVNIVADNLQSRGLRSLIGYLKNNNIPLVINNNPRKIEHNKFAIFDSKIMITGSYNWTNNATKNNSENCLIETQPYIINAYQDRFTQLWQQYNNIATEVKTDRHFIKPKKSYIRVYTHYK